jgi:hypothetical protein
MLLAGPTTFGISEVIFQFIPTHYPPLSPADAQILADASANAHEPARSWYADVGAIALGLWAILLLSAYAIIASLPVAIPASIISTGITEMFWRKFGPSFLVPTFSGAACAFIGTSLYPISPPDGDMPLAGPLLWSSPVAGAAMGSLYYLVARKRLHGRTES